MIKTFNLIKPFAVIIFFPISINLVTATSSLYANELLVVNEVPIEKMPESELKLLISEGIALLNKGSYEQASISFSKALKLDPAKSWLQFLNGLSFHLRAIAGNGSLFEMAEQGYLLAIKFDESNWMARYYLGLLYLDQRKFEIAQKKFGEVLLANADNADIVYSMLYASYYAGDPQTADAMLSRLKMIAPDDPRILKLSPVLSAALNKPEQAKAELDRYSAIAGNTADLQMLASRIADWKRFYKYYQPAAKQTEVGLPGAQNIPSVKQEITVDVAKNPVIQEVTPSATPVPMPPVTTRIAPQPLDGPIDEEMVSVDVVMISTEESVSTIHGVNLLNGLKLQYGGNYKYARDTKQESGTPDTVALVTNLLHSITIPAVNYSLNIFNSSNERSEILARPTLTALNGMQSVFFSGNHIEAATVSTSTTGGDAVKIAADIGVKLAIQPQILSRKKLRLNVTAERTFLKTPSPDIQYSSKVEMSKINVQANVVMEFGETLVLSGLSEKETQNERDGVPFLQNIPLIQYLFSEKRQLDFHRSVLILITPRSRLNVYVSTAAEKEDSNSSVISELQARYSDWFKPYPNLSSVFHHMQSNSLYREFRTGDVSMERWNSQQTLKDALRQAKQFLYY